MVDVREILAMQVQRVGQIVIPSREDNGSSITNPAHSAARLRFKRERRLFFLTPSCPSCPSWPLSLYREHLFVECHLQIEGVDDAAVVAKRLGAGRFLERRDEG